MTSSSSFDITILYGSQTGNAEFLAYNISEATKNAGLNTELLSLNEALEQDSLNWQRLLIVTSTHDNGHMPDNANGFWNWLQTCHDGQFAGLPFAVLAIGDSMYDDFCKAGKDFDQRFQELGAVAIVDRIDCDVDFDMTSQKWINAFIEKIPETVAWTPVTVNDASKANAADFVDSLEPWFTAEITNHRVLTEPESAKKVVHFDIKLDDEFLYLPGDSVEIEVANNDELISQWQEYFPSTSEIVFRGDVFSFGEALKHKLELRLPHPGLLNDFLALAPESPEKQALLQLIESGDRQSVDQWIWGKDVLEIVKLLNLNVLSLEAIIAAMRPLQPRSYSIASSPHATPGQLSLTVSVISYQQNGREHVGAGTNFLESRAQTGEPIKIRRIIAHEFRLPTNNASIIMIGPGVGVAPFIGFLQELEVSGSGNRSWLFFGDQHQKTDSLYRHDLDRWKELSVLTHLNRAFSRDQEQKHYVQDDLLAHAQEVREWIAEGAYIYVCGDKNRMAHDVEKALVSILAEDAPEDIGREKLELLKAGGRYAKDVY